MKQIYSVILILILALSVGCSGSKSYSNKAKKLQKSGLNDEASSFYFQSLLLNPTNVDAKIGLKQTGQIRIEATLTEFYKAYSVANYRESVYKYREALALKEKYGKYVSLEIPAYYEANYIEMRDIYIDKRYEKAGDLLYAEKFDDANVIYKEILQIYPEYKDVADLSLSSTIEPLYRKGINAFDADEFRKCYGYMVKVLKQKSSYKDAIDFKNRALEEGQVTIAVMPFESNIAEKSVITQSIQSDVIAGIIKSKDPFIKVLDRTNADKLIKEQQISVQGNGAIQAGELLGANLLVTGKLIAYTYSGGKVTRKIMQGFESYQVKMLNRSNNKIYYETRFNRVFYFEFTGQSSLTAELQYQLISAETGEVLNAEVLKDTKIDRVNYVNYKGDYRKLYPGKFSGPGNSFINSDQVYTSMSKVRSLRGKAVTKKRTLKSEGKLSIELTPTFSKGVVKGVVKYNGDE